MLPADGRPMEYLRRVDIDHFSGRVGRSIMVTLKINGESHTVDASPDMPLLWVLRDLLGMNGTKFGIPVMYVTLALPAGWRRYANHAFQRFCATHSHSGLAQ